MLGASTGTMMKMVITKDITRAMSRPAKRSRTTATATMRGAAAPIPCSARPARCSSKLGASMAATVPMANTTSPAVSTGLRPKRSDSGPWKGWLAANPSM